MCRSNIWIITIIITALICPAKVVTSNSETIIENEDLPEDIPSPSQQHNIEKFTIEPCQVKENCILNSSNLIHNEIRGEFQISEDRDVFWINTNSSDKYLVYEVCINSSSVPIIINSYQRNSMNSSLNSLDYDGTLISETPTTDITCNKYPPIDENYDEFWIKVGSLSTSGNYSLIIYSHQVGTIGQISQNNESHIEFSNKGFTANLNPGVINLTMINHTINEGQLWELELISDTPHKVISICHFENKNNSICFERNSTPHEKFHKTNYFYYPPKNIQYIEIILETQNWFSTWSVKNKLQKNSDPFADENGDAPGNSTDLQCFDSCPEFLANNGLSYFGSMPLSIFDEADVWKINVNRGSSETFLIDIQIKCEPFSIVLELHVIDKDGNSNLTYIVPDSTNWNSLQAEIPSGTHYIRLVSTNAGNLRDWNYGDLNKSVVNYELKIKWIENKTDMNLTYEISEELLFWDKILVWFIGICMILPMVWVIFNLKKDRARMQLLLHDKNRLSRLKKIRSNSEINEAKADLKLFINSITDLNWNILIQNWGIPDLSYVTESISVNSWKLDKKIATNNGLPLLVIIETHKNDWEIAAIKFESTSDKEWEILSIQPNLLFRNNEIFLDTIKTGNKITVEVEILGKADDVQMYISGMSEGKPVAIKTPNSMSLHEEE